MSSDLDLAERDRRGEAGVVHEFTILCEDVTSLKYMMAPLMVVPGRL